jgi:hypothetical protein
MPVLISQMHLNIDKQASLGVIATLFLGCCIFHSSASKDSKSYGSYTNPNLAYDHYWSDASNVLQDLSSFNKLYVQYYGCA